MLMIFLQFYLRKNNNTTRNQSKNKIIMKKRIFLPLIAFLLVSVIYAAENSMNDTTFQYQKKTIKLIDEKGKLNVKVYESITDSGSVEYKQVYEGVFSDEQSFEKYTVLEDLGFQIPGITNKNKKHNHDIDYDSKKEMEAHWAGFSVGFSNVVNSNNKLATFYGTKVFAEKSLEWSLNINEYIIPLYRNVFGLTTGFGFCWRNYGLLDNMHLEETDGIVVTYPADAGIVYESSRLRMLHLTLPIFLEWQPNFGSNHDLFITAGVVGGLKTFANYKVKFEDENENTVKRETAKGLNIPPLTLDYMVQAGYKDFSLYAKYSPLELFRKGEGPQMQSVSVGFTLNFND